VLRDERVSKNKIILNKIIKNVKPLNFFISVPYLSQKNKLRPEKGKAKISPKVTINGFRQAFRLIKDLTIFLNFKDLTLRKPKAYYLLLKTARLTKPNSKQLEDACPPQSVGGPLFQKRAGGESHGSKKKPETGFLPLARS